MFVEYFKFDKFCPFRADIKQAENVILYMEWSNTTFVHRLRCPTPLLHSLLTTSLSALPSQKLNTSKILKNKV